LNLITKTRNLPSHPVVNLYRAMIKELPKVLSIYDIDMPVQEARDAVRRQFRSNDGVRDPIVVDRLIAVGHQELEETLMQWKQKSQLMKVLEGIKTGAALKVPGSDASDEDTFYRHDPR